MDPRKLLPVALTLLALLSPVTGRASGGGGEPSPYLPLDPPFVTNLVEGTRMRFMQVKMQVTAEEMKELKLVQAHMPAVRDRVLMLLTEQKLDTLRNPPEREKLRQECLNSIRKVMEERVGKPVVNQVYFTDFVVQ